MKTVTVYICSDCNSTFSPTKGIYRFETVDAMLCPNCKKVIFIEKSKND